MTAIINNQQQQQQLCQQSRHDTYSKPEATKFSSSSDSLNSDSNVINFYKNKKILITGGSGFLGKVVIWKLLETCPDIAKIYVLLRSKNNISAEKRLIHLLKGKPFSFKHDYTKLLQKIVAIESDMTVENLGLSQTDRTLLEDEVNIVLHSAASVSFDAPLKDNLRDNVFGTRSIVKLCENIKNLQALVHVSTAYSNCQLKAIEEKVIPLEEDLDQIMQKLEALPDGLNHSITDKFLEGRPNTYTYTKAVAEQYVARQEGKFPVTIVRPSIVISSAEEPCKGWVDNINGIAGLGSLAAVGVLRTIDWNYYAVSDMVPVDKVANCLICAAYQVSTNSPDKLLVFNMTSGNLNPISWGKFFELLRDEAVERPPTKIVRPIIKSPKHNRANPISFFLTKVFSELLFAYTVDIILTLIGYKKIMIKITRKMHHGYEILKPFTTNEWDLHSSNVVQMSESLTTKDKSLFKFDMREIDWKDQARVTYDGARIMVLKEEPTELSFQLGRKRQRLVTLIHYGFMSFFIILFSFLIYHGFKLTGLL